MTYHLSKTIVLVGLMGAGKTAIGSIVAQKIGCDFLDSDIEIEKAAQMSIAEIFLRDGEAFFREKESQVLARLLEGPACLLSTGGGVYMLPKNRKVITEKAVAVWLQADLDLLWLRVKGNDTRPLLQVEKPYEALKVFYKERTPIYACSEITVLADDSLNKEDMADKVISHLLNNPKSGLKKVTKHA